MKRTTTSILSSLALIALMPAVVHAHAGHDFGAHHFQSGLAHPFTGLDHILAMLAVGMWTVQLGGRARWAVPVGFLAMMAAGAMLAMSHLALPLVESTILASVLIMGLLLLFALRLPIAPAVALAGVFALCHGYAHAAEGAATGAYMGGFLLASAALLTAGAALGSLLTMTLQQPRWLRAAGGAIAAAGLVLAMG
jgi:urease accessory protein